GARAGGAVRGRRRARRAGRRRSRSDGDRDVAARTPAAHRAQGDEAGVAARRHRDRLHHDGHRRGSRQGHEDRHSGDGRLPDRREEARQACRVPAHEHRRQRGDHAARRRQGGRAREDAQGDFQMRLALLVAVGFRAQAPLQPPTPADFGQWERLVPAGDRGGLSPDGRWLAYAINRTNGENELRVTGVADGTTKTVGFGAQPAFSADSKGGAGPVGVSEAQQDKLRKEKKPLHRKLALINLASGEQTTIDGVESFAFSADGRQLLMRHYAPERPNAARGDTEAPALPDPDDTPGVTVVVRTLAD